MRTHPRACALLLVAAAGLLTGCPYSREHGHLHFGAAVVLDRMMREESPDYRDPVYAEPVVVNNVYVNTAPPSAFPAPPPSRRDRVPVDDEAPPFDAAKARSELASVDVSACRASGAPRGYGHAVATFNPAGNISKVVIDTPANLPPQAVTCLGHALGTATVPVFRGSLITVGTTWFVP